MRASLRYRKMHACITTRSNTVPTFGKEYKSAAATILEDQDLNVIMAPTQARLQLQPHAPVRLHRATSKPSGSRRPRTTSTTSRAAPPSSDHVDRDHVDHVPSSSAELRPPRPQDYVAMMIAAKNGATTIATTVMTTGRKARGPDNFIANDTSSHLSNIATRRLHPPVVNKAKYYF